MTRRMLLALWGGVLLCTACGPQEHPALYRYNDMWEGEVRFDGQPPLPLRADIYVTQMDMERSRKENNNLYQRAYVELTFGERALVGWGEATHTDMRDVSQSSYSATPEREFLMLSLLGHVQELAGSEGSALSQQRYKNTYEAFMSERRLRAHRDDVRLVGEKLGNTVEGVVVVVTYPSQGGAGVRHLGGTFRLSRVGIAPGRPVDDWQVETERYLFRSEAENGSLASRIFIK